MRICAATGLTSPARNRAARWRRGGLAFTLLEVLIAAAIFFMGMFALLGVLSSGLHAASLLQKNAPTAGMAVAKLTLTNKLEEIPQSGDFGELYPNYRWELYPHEILTNGLFQVDVTVYHDNDIYSRMNILLFRPDSPKSF
jgi:Tfp pilus assembly protein PilV